MSNTWEHARSFMDKHCGVALAQDQAYLMDSRLAPVAREHKFSSLEDYVASACAPGAKIGLAQSLIDAMTTHESYFFRDTPFWDGFVQQVLPKLKATNKKTLRIWSSACSHGQEVYTIAMILAELAPELVEAVTITATDISEPAVVRGRAGVYSTLETNRGLTAVRLMKHFEKAEGGFRVKQMLRERITWRPHNLLEPMQTTAGLYDVVLCRNVFIYFNDRDRKTAMSHIIAATTMDGYVGLGTSEIYLRPALAPGWFARPKQG